jgi:hypothetical protein
MAEFKCTHDQRTEQAYGMLHCASCGDLIAYREDDEGEWVDVV